MASEAPFLGRGCREAAGVVVASGRLQDFFIQHQRIAVAFSGGVDSSYLLYAATTAGCDVRAYYIKSQFQPQFELDDAARLTESLGAKITVAALDVLSNQSIAQNPPDRCYHCKSAIFTKIWELARADGFSVLCDGTNADDDASDRAGMRALKEMGVTSPLQEAGLTKSAIRSLSQQAGLFTHDKPSYACLATHIPAGTAITEQLLAKIERAENALFEMGFADFRVRILPPCNARVQMPGSQWDKAAACRKEILSALQPDFNAVLLDLDVR